MDAQTNFSRIGPLLVFLVVLANITAASLLSYGADNFPLISVAAFIIFFGVLVISIGRIFLWNWIHRHVDLSRSYALTSLFFPLIALIAAYKGETILPIQWGGIFLICLGVSWIAVFTRDQGDVR